MFNGAFLLFIVLCCFQLYCPILSTKTILSTFDSFVKGETHLLFLRPEDSSSPGLPDMRLLLFPSWDPAVSEAECVIPMHALDMNTAGHPDQHKQGNTPLYQHQQQNVTWTSTTSIAPSCAFLSSWSGFKFIQISWLTASPFCYAGSSSIYLFLDLVTSQTNNPDLIVSPY